MHKEIATLNNWELKSQIETQQTTYEYMLQYMAMGTQDPQREAIYNQLLCKGYELADKTYFLKEWDKAYGFFADTFRKFAQTPPHSFKELDFMLEAAKRTFDMSQVNKEEAQRIHSYRLHEHTIDELFNKIWVSTQWSEEDYQEARELLFSPSMAANDKAVMISAVTLNLLQQGFLIGTTQTVDSMQERLVKIKFVGFQKLNSAWLESKPFCLHIYI